MLTGIDHVIFAVSDPDAAVEALSQSLGLAAGGGGRHDAHGTFNRLAWLGDSYIEFMAVFDADLAAESWWGAHILRILSDSLAGGGLAGAPMASDDVDADVVRLRAQGSTIEDASAGERLRPDGEPVRWRMARLPAVDTELGLEFLIEHDVTAAEWRPPERAARAGVAHPLGGPVTLARVELQVGDVARASLRLLRELGVQFRPSLAGGGARDASIGPHTLRLRPLRAGMTGTPSVVLRGGRERRSQSLYGADWLIEPAI